MRVAKNPDSILVDIDFAQDGVEYRCLDCDEILIRKDKNKLSRLRDIHFAHKSGKVCSGNLETYLHKIAKWIIGHQNEILLPSLGYVTYQNPEIEYTVENYRADAMIAVNDDRHAIEIYVTHLTDDSKVKALSSLGIVITEINLSDLDYASSLDSIAQNVIHNRLNRKRLLPSETSVEETKRAKPESGTSDSTVIDFFICAATIVIGFFTSKKFLPRRKKKRYNRSARGKKPFGK